MASVELEEMEKQVRRQAYKEEHGTLNPCDLCKIPLEKQADCPYFEGKGSICEGLKIGKEVSHGLVATYIMQSHVFKTMDDTEEVYFYKDGCYQPQGEVVIKGEVEKLFDEEDKLTSNFVNEVISHIQRRTYTKRVLFDTDPSLLVVENGILDKENRILNDFTPNYLSLIKLPVIFDPLAECPLIEKFLSEIVDPENIEVLKEFVGYILESSYFIQKALMLIGEADAGKSTYINLLLKFIGNKLSCNEPLQDLIYKDFACANLYGKMLNGYADLSNIKLTRTGKFKALTGADRVKGRTLYHQAFYFWNRCKLLFSTNTLPKSEDVTDAYFKRWIIIPFPNRFADTNPKTDKRLIDKLSTSEELSGLLNIALEKLKKLRKNQRFSYGKQINEIRDYYLRLSNSVYAFIEAECVKDHKVWVIKEDLYNAFNKYCDDNKLTKMSQRAYTDELKKQVFPLREERRTIRKGLRKNIWIGIALKSQMKDEREGDSLDLY